MNHQFSVALNTRFDEPLRHLEGMKYVTIYDVLKIDIFPIKTK